MEYIPHQLDTSDTANIQVFKKVLCIPVGAGFLSPAVSCFIWRVAMWAVVWLDHSWTIPTVIAGNSRIEAPGNRKPNRIISNFVPEVNEPLSQAWGIIPAPCWGHGRGIKNRQWLFPTQSGPLGGWMAAHWYAQQMTAESYRVHGASRCVCTWRLLFVSHAPYFRVWQRDTKGQDIKSKCCTRESCCCMPVNLLTSWGCFWHAASYDMTGSQSSDLYSTALPSINKSIHPSMPS